jgi:hypothetical protein
LKEVDSSPFQALPIAISSVNDHDGAQGTDRVDILGPIVPETLPGVTSLNKPPPFTQPQKKSLFARQREAKRASSPSTEPDATSSAGNSTSISSDSPQVPFIISDLVERDIVSFDDLKQTSFRRERQETGFPMPEKIEIPTTTTTGPLDGTYAGRPQEPIEPVRVFYSSARDRLDPIRTIEVHEDGAEEPEEELQRGADILQRPPGEFSNLMQEISTENDSSIGKMTVEEIERLQQELAAHLNPKFMAMLKERGQQKALASKQDAVGAKLAYGANNVAGPIESRGESQGAWKVVDDEESVVTSTGVYSIPTSRGTTQTSRKSNFLAEVERKKREWLKPVEHDSTVDNEVNHLTAELYRFDFEGRLMSYPTPKGNIQVESPGATQDLNMLLHHGDNPSEPGYTIDELSHLCRSTHPSQRISALRAIGNIIFKAKHAYYALPQLFQILPKSGPFEFFPNSLFLSHMIQTLNIPIILRMAIDDKSNTIILEALYALHALICSEADENTEILASIPQSACYAYPLEPTDDNKQPFSKKSEWDNQSDVERCQVDLIAALLQAGLLARLRYILGSKSSNIMCTLVLQIMIRCARHSVDACEHFKSCPNLLKTLKELLIPMSVTSQRPLDPNAPLLIKLVQVICQGSRDACEKAISVGLVSACFQFIYLPTESSSIEAIHTMIEALSVFTVCIRYADFKSEIVNVLELLVELITWKSKSTSLPPHTRKHVLQSAVWRLLTAMVPMARDIPEGEDIPNFAVLWSHVSPLLPLALTALRTFESTSGTPISSDSDSLLASILEFLAEYFKQLQDYPPRTFESELGQIKFISEKTLWPFLVRSPYFSQIVVKLSESSSWKSSASYFNVVPAGLYTLRLKSHPTWSWKQQQTLKSASKQDGTGISSTTLEQDLHTTLPNDIRGSTILHNASVLLSALKMVSAVSIHNSWLAASLTASDISGPLLSMLEHYSDWAMSCSGSLGSSYATRALHLLAFHAIKLLYRTSIVAQEASLSCLAHLLPGDEDLSEYLISRVALYYQPDGEQDVPVEHSLLRKLETDSGAFMFLLLSLSNGSSDQGSKSRVGKQFEYDPTQRLSLLIDTEFSCQPFGKHWPYFPITSFVKIYNAEMDDHALSRQKAQRDAIHRGVEQHLESQARSSNDDSRVEEDVQLELEEDMELFGDYEDKNLKKTLKQARDLLPALLNFALSMERSNMGFAKKLKRSVKIYSVMQVFTLGPKLFLEASISQVLENLLQIFVSKGWEATRLGITLNTALIENLVDHWANESFGDKVVGTAVSLWLSTASELNAAEILASGQLSEVRAVDAALWPAYSVLWHLLPTPSSSLHSIYFLENIAMRPLVAEQLLIAICSPHTPRMRSSWNFWYRFTIYQLSRYFISDNSDNVNLWIRTNSLQSLLSDLSSTFSAGERNEVIHDLFALSRDQLLTFSAAPTADLQNIPTGETSQVPPQLLTEIHKAL